MSSPTLASSPFLSPPPSFHRSSRSGAGRTPPPREFFRSEGRPRLSSPHLFREFFSSMPDSGSRRCALPTPARRSSRRQDEAHSSFANAIQRTTRAVANAGEAFQARVGTSRSEGRSEVVDLTDSPPAENGGGRSDSRDDRGSEFAMTTHPQDSRQLTRGLSTLHEPIFGYAPIFAPGPSVEDPSDSLVRARNRRARIVQTVNTARRQSDERAERDAIRRQQENHAAWQRTQARTRHLQEYHQELDQLPSSPTPTPSLSPTPVDSIFGSSRCSSPLTMPSTEKIESVDLTQVDDDKAVAAVLAKQRVDAIEAQKPNTSTEAGRTTFTAYKCPICMDTLKNATTTICGHLFCHRCIVDTLNWSAAQKKQETGTTRKVNGVCPVCRKVIAVKDSPGTGRTLVIVEMKLLTKKRKRDDKGKGRADSEFSKGKGRPGKKVKRETTEEFFSHITNDNY